MVIPIVYATPQYDEAIRLRHNLLRAPLGLRFRASDLEEECEQFHLGYYDAHMELLACLTFKVDDAAGRVLKMRQVAVAEKAQRKGIGRALVEAGEAIAKAAGCLGITMHARERALPFYEKLGYEKSGRKFTEVGLPHYRMGKIL